MNLWITHFHFFSCQVFFSPKLDKFIKKGIRQFLGINIDKKLFLVCAHFIKWQDDNGIIYMSIYDFLLNE